MRPLWLLALAACGFRGRAQGSDDAAVDAAFADATNDGTLPSPTCARDAHLQVCFSFDASPLPPIVPDEGAVAVNAQLTNVTRIASPNGGAALLGATSEIYAPQAAIANIQSIEMWIRIDAEPAPGARSGLLDANTNTLALFYNVNATLPMRELRCTLGGVILVSPKLPAPTPSWRYVACTCTGGTMAMYLDGDLLVSQVDACGAGFVGADGLVIGQNNNGAGTASEPLIGAIDEIRLWDTALSGPQICAAARRETCAQ